MTGVGKRRAMPVNTVSNTPDCRIAVSNEISGVQAQNIECASVQFYLSVHLCAHKILNLYL